MNVRKIKKWLRNNNFEFDVKKNDCFCYDTNEECILIADNLSEAEHYDSYLKYITKLGYNDHLNPRTVSFLHELGHAETIDDLPDIDYVIDKLRDVVETPCLCMTTLKIKANIYFRLPVERKATQWAVEFIRDFPKEVHELDRLFQYV